MLCNVALLPVAGPCLDNLLFSGSCLCLCDVMLFDVLLYCLVSFD